MVIVTAGYESPVGLLGLGVADSGVVRVNFGDLVDGDGDSAGARAILDRLRRELDGYFAGSLTEFTVPVDLSEAPEFDRRALQALMRVPYGETISYGRLTEAAGLPPSAVRGVGQAMGRNPIPVVVPCHRVIGADGSLVGFGGGLQRKRKLLDLESEWSTPRLDLGL
ncbi:MAG TPA: methylated-DNA--[protein]-cysteine S-methyltransferase [Mycobacteriales bacterium]|nr:methylated-DNA--[protein]-cysteine S-methyltransferase [Mycobacteriales bacterium]